MSALLYDYWRSTSAYRVRIGLSLLGIPFERRAINLLEGKQREADYLLINAQGLVPALAIDGRILTQSLAILEYLNETRSGSLLPDDAGGRARVRALSYAIAMDLHPICNLSVAQYAIASSRGVISMPNWMQHFITQGLSAFEGLLADSATGSFCHGSALSMADICLAAQAYNASRWNVSLGQYPLIARIVSTLEKIPAIIEAHPDRYSPTAVASP